MSNISLRKIVLWSLVVHLVEQVDIVNVILVLVVKRRIARAALRYAVERHEVPSLVWRWRWHGGRSRSCTAGGGTSSHSHGKSGEYDYFDVILYFYTKELIGLLSTVSLFASLWRKCNYTEKNNSIIIVRYFTPGVAFYCQINFSVTWVSCSCETYTSNCTICRYYAAELAFHGQELDCNYGAFAMSVMNV